MMCVYLCFYVCMYVNDNAAVVHPGGGGGGVGLEFPREGLLFGPE